MIEIAEFFTESNMAFFMSYITLITSVSAIVFLSMGKSFVTRRAWIVGCMLAFLVASYLSVGELLGRPKPVGVLTDVMPYVEEATIHGADLRPDEAMYLMLTWKGVASPRLIVLPWDNELAEEIQEGLEGLHRGEIKRLTIKYPFSVENDNRPPVIHPIPWPKPPEKEIAPPTLRNLNEIQQQQSAPTTGPRRGPR